MLLVIPRLLLILIIFSTLSRLLAATQLPIRANLKSDKAPELIEQFNGSSTEKIPFYKSKDSQFSSGFSSYDKLSDTMTEIDTSEEYFLKYNSQKISSTLLPILTAFDLSKTWITKYTKKKITPMPNLSLAEILLNYETDPTDLGYVITLKSAHVRTASNINAKIISTTKENEKFIPLSFENSFIKILYKNKYGYLDINDCMTKFDFAQFIYPYNSTQKQWQKVKNRQFTLIQTQDQKLYPMNSIQGLVVNEKMAIIHKANSQFPVWTSFKIVKDQVDPWRKSDLPGHGFVWWKKTNATLAQLEEIEIDDMMKKVIHSISFCSSSDNEQNKFSLNKNCGVASTNDGVYFTTNGQQWQPIKQFKNYSGPVHIFNDKIIFVGTFKSTDGGKSFSNYVQIDKISEAISQKSGYLPKKIKITKINTYKPYHLFIEVDSLGKKYTLKSSLISQEWKTVR